MSWVVVAYRKPYGEDICGDRTLIDPFNPSTCVRPVPLRSVDQLLRIGRPLEAPTGVSPSGSTLFTHSLNTLRKGALGLPALSHTVDQDPTGGGAGDASEPLDNLRSHVTAQIALNRLKKSVCPRTLVLRGRDWQQSKQLKLRSEEFARWGGRHVAVALLTSSSPSLTDHAAGILASCIPTTPKWPP